jgi:hypothetical protein
MEELQIKMTDRAVVEPARSAAEEAEKKGKVMPEYFAEQLSSFRTEKSLPARIQNLCMLPPA